MYGEGLIASANHYLCVIAISRRRTVGLVKDDVGVIRYRPDKVTLTAFLCLVLTLGLDVIPMPEGGLASLNPLPTVGPNYLNPHREASALPLDRRSLGADDE